MRAHSSHPPPPTGLLETFRFDYEYEFELRVQFFGTTKILAGLRKVVVESNFVAVLLFAAKNIVEDLVLGSITSSKSEKSYL